MRLSLEKSTKQSKMKLERVFQEAPIIKRVPKPDNNTPTDYKKLKIISETELIEPPKRPHSGRNDGETLLNKDDKEAANQPEPKKMRKMDAQLNDPNEEPQAPKALHNNRRQVIGGHLEFTKQRKPSVYQILQQIHISIIATRVIRLISKSIKEQDSMEMKRSLVQRVIDSIKDYSGDDLSFESTANIIKTAKESVERFFSGGCLQKKYLQDQQRQNPERSIDFEKSIQASIFSESSEDNDWPFNESSSQNSVRFNFIPTSLVTGQIFSQILSSNSKRLFTGEAGIGKTYSFILYQKLSELIFKCKQLIREHPDETKFAQRLISNINFSIPKLIYWRPRLDDKSPDVSKVIRNQCYEITKEYPAFSLMEEQKRTEWISQMYRTEFGIRMLLVVDQVDLLANTKNQSHKQHSSNPTKQDSLDQSDKYLRQIRKCVKATRKKLESTPVGETTELLKELRNHYQLGISQKRPASFQKNQSADIGETKRIQKFYNKALYYQQKSLKRLIGSFTNILLISSQNIEAHTLQYLGLRNMSYFKQFRFSKPQRLQFSTLANHPISKLDFASLIIGLLKQELCEMGYLQEQEENVILQSQKSLEKILEKLPKFLATPMTIRKVIEENKRQLGNETLAFHLIKLQRRNLLSDYLWRFAQKIQEQTQSSIKPARECNNESSEDSRLMLKVDKIHSAQFN